MLEERIKKTWEREGRSFLAWQEGASFTFYNIPYARLDYYDNGLLNIFGQPRDYLLEDFEAGERVNGEQPGPMCLQSEDSVGIDQMSPQCQSLTLWVSQRVLEGKKKVPVLFYIHGGSFMGGSNRNPEFNGKNLSEDMDVVVVIPNYRLGPLGYYDFSFLDQRFTPNNAYRDLLSALRWVHRYIAYFQGDPDNVTIMGESSGGTMTSAFPFIKDAQGLFHKLIILSGIPSAFLSTSWSQRRGQKYLDYLAAHYHLSWENMLDPDHWGEVAQSIHPFSIDGKMGASAYPPSTDGEIIPANPIYCLRQAAEEGQKWDIPIWGSMTLDEMSLLSKYPTMDRDWGMRPVFEEGMEQEDPRLVEKISQLYRRLYGVKEAESQAFSDMMIRTALIWYMDEAAFSGQAYFTRLDWRTPMQQLSQLGSFHSSDLYLFFNNPGAPLGKVFFSGIATSSLMDKLVKEVHRDLETFLKQGYILDVPQAKALPPYRAEEKAVKAYDKDSRLKVVMPRQLQELWSQTRYYQSQFRKFD